MRCRGNLWAGVALPQRRHAEHFPVRCRKRYAGRRRTEQRREAGPIGDEEASLAGRPPRRAPVRTLKNQSGCSVFQSELDLKRWMARLPTVSEARPTACPSCGAPSCPFDGRIQLQGHGFRERQVRGPPGPDAKATVVVVTGRRYRCVRCDAVLLVVPQEVLPRRQYSAAAIGCALALWGLVKATALVVRRRISAAATLGFDAMSGWATLRRWAKAVRARRLFASVPAAASSATLRQVAAHAATALAATADATTRGLPIEQRAFLGAAHAA